MHVTGSILLWHVGSTYVKCYTIIICFYGFLIRFFLCWFLFFVFSWFLCWNLMFFYLVAFFISYISNIQHIIILLFLVLNLLGWLVFTVNVFIHLKGKKKPTHCVRIEITWKLMWPEYGFATVVLITFCVWLFID